MVHGGYKGNIYASSQALLAALDETSLTMTLGILVAQRQASLLFNVEAQHLKLLSNLYDEVCALDESVLVCAVLTLAHPYVGCVSRVGSAKRLWCSTSTSSTPTWTASATTRCCPR